MKLFLLASLAVSSAFALRETVQEAAMHARTLLHKENILTLSSIFKESVNPALAGQPFALTEYYCDCSKDGTPTLLLMDLEITTRNLKNGSPLAVSIDTTPPKGIYSVASLPRMNLNGRMVKVEGEKEEKEALECYLTCHPDAIEWTPNTPGHPHAASWYQYQVESVYYFGGFGNVSYIGFLPIDMYRGIDLPKHQHEFEFKQQS